MPNRVDLVPIEAEELLAGIQRQIDAGNSGVLSQVGAVRFFSPSSVGAPPRYASETLSENSFREQDYLLANPDVADAVRTGEFKSGWEHWIAVGKEEGRSIEPVQFSEIEYLELNPDIASLIQNGSFASGLDHWNRRGRLEGRNITKPRPPSLPYLKQLCYEIQGRLAQMGEAPPSPGTLRGALGRHLILILRRLLWWYTRPVSMWADVTTRAVQEQQAVFEHLAAVQEESRRTSASIQDAVRLIAAQMDERAEQIRGLEGALAAERAARESITTRFAAVAAEIQSLRSSGSAPQRKVEPRTSPTSSDHTSDALYLAFEDVFRGPREEIKRRQSVYLPFLEEIRGSTALSPILDLGCGRGEWLELLRDHHMTARGRDHNVAMVEYCRALGLDAEWGEALASLRDLPDGSLGAVTSFHMIEHTPFDAVLSLLRESMRVLEPGGLLILETPNPKNLTVASYSFFLDPTHLKPLPSEMLRFFAEATGFSRCQVLELQPAQPPAGEPTISQHLNALLYGPLDYGLIARRP